MGATARCWNIGRKDMLREANGRKNKTGSDLKVV